MAAYHDDREPRRRGTEQSVPSGGGSTPTPGKSPLTSQIVGASPLAPSSPGEPNVAPPPPPTNQSTSSAGADRPSAISAASSDEFLEPAPLPLPTVPPKTSALSTHVAPTPIVTASPELSSASDVEGIVAALGQREHAITPLFANARQRIKTVAADHAARARADAERAAMSIQSQGVQLSRQLNEAAHAQGARMKDAAAGAAHQITASSTVLDGQVTVLGPAAVGSVADADANERTSVQAAIDHTVHDIHAEIDNRTMWSRMRLQSEAASRAGDCKNAATEIWLKAAPAFAEAATGARQVGESIAIEIDHRAAASLTAIDSLEQQVAAGIQRARLAAAAALSSRPGSDGPSPSVVARHRAQLHAIDDFIASLGSELGRAATDLAARGDARLGAVRATYALADQSLRTQLLPQVTKMESDWRAGADELVAATQQYVRDVRDSHSEIATQLGGRFHEVAQHVVTEMRRSNMSEVWSAAQSIGKTVAIWVGLAIAGAVLVLIDLPELGIAAALVIGAECAGAAVALYGFLQSETQHSAEAAKATEDLPWYDQILAQARATFVATGDVTMVTPLAEAATGHDAMSGGELSSADRVERLALGVGGLLVAKGAHEVLPLAAKGFEPGREGMDSPEQSTTRTDDQTTGKSAPKPHPGDDTNTEETSKKSSEPASAPQNGAQSQHPAPEPDTDAADPSVAHGPAQAAKTAPDRVNAPSPGLYEGVSENSKIADWKIDDMMQWENGKKVLMTSVTLPDGRSGWIERAYDPRTKTLEMRNAFLKELPGWVDDGGTALIEGKGTPTVTYLTLRQMKKLGVEYGELSTVKMSTIQNVRAVIEYNAALAAELPPEQAVMKTHSVEYGETSIVQSGHQIVSATVEGRPRYTPLDELLEHWETGGRPGGPRDPEVFERHDAQIREYGKGVITRLTWVVWDYDIVLKVAPFGGKP